MGKKVKSVYVCLGCKSIVPLKAVKNKLCLDCGGKLAWIAGASGSVNAYVKSIREKTNEA